MAKQRIRRAAPVAGLAARTAVGRVGAALRRRLGDDDAVVAFHERNAARYAETLGNAKGLLMKAGQLASFVDPTGIVGVEHWGPYRDALAALRDDVEPMAPELARAVVESELGAPPEELFASFDPVAFAAASIGQVHRAVRHDGRVVAVKVQYPGAADAIAADLANVELIATMVRLAKSVVPRMPQVDIDGMVAELTERFTEELDYRIELANLAEFAAIYAGDPDIRIPAGHPDLSSERVLTMDFAEGLGFSAACGASQELRNRWGAVANRFFLDSIYRHGAYHADPHPGNYLFGEDGSVTFLDFGCVKHYDAGVLAIHVEMGEAARLGDAGRLAAIFRSPGFVVDDSVTGEDLLGFCRPMFRWVTDPQPLKMTPAYLVSVFEAVNPRGDGGEVTQKLSTPPAMIMAGRIYVGGYSVLGALECEIDFLTPYLAAVDAYYETFTTGRRRVDASPPAGASTAGGPAAGG